MNSAGTKRNALQDSGGAASKKRSKLDFDIEAKFSASSQDDLDINLLRVQNRRLAERLVHRQRIESELRSRIEQLEKKQLNEDTKLYVIIRYWNQLNEDMRLILQRFEPPINGDSSNSSTSNEDEDSAEENDINCNQNAETTSFMRQLANMDKEELDEHLQQRVMLSTRAVSKVLQAFDRIIQRNEKVMIALKACSNGEDFSDDDEIENDDENGIKSPDHNELNEDLAKRKRKNKRARTRANLDELVKQHNEELTKENKNLNLLVTSLHEKNHTMSLKLTQLNDKLESKDLQVDDLKNRIDELEFELNKFRTREQRLETNLYEAREKLRDLQTAGNEAASSNKQDTVALSSGSGFSSAKIEDLKRELEEQREQSSLRLQELEQLNNEHKDALKLMEKYKMDLQCLPDSVIHDSAEFKSLQSHFSVLFNESVQLKNQLDDARLQLTQAKNTHLRQIEQMESEELSMQKRLRNECIQLEDSLAQVRKEYEMLRLEFEQTLAANEQSGPINREMRHLVSSLQNHIQQLKGENNRVKKKLKEANIEISRMKQIMEQNGLKVCCGGILLPSTNKTVVASDSDAACFSGDCCSQASKQTRQTPVSVPSKVETPMLMSDSSNDASSSNLAVVTSKQQQQQRDAENNQDALSFKNEQANNSKFEIKIESSSAISSTTSNATPTLPVTIKKEEPTTTSADVLESSTSNIDYEQENQSSSSVAPPHGAVLVSSHGTVHQSSTSSSSVRKLEESIRELKVQLKRSTEANRELKLLLDMFKSVDKEKREKIHIMAAEKKLRIEIEELRQYNKKLLERGGGGPDGRRLSGDRGARLSEEDYHRKVQKYEEVIQQLQKNVNLHKQEEEALLNEMEVTGQAFEDMQEQNCRLIQQLREKDDANFKLMSERIKSNQIHKLLKEKKELLAEQIVTLQQQLDAQNQVVRKLEEKERHLQSNLTLIEKELQVRQQAMDFHKRKAVEASQAAQDLKLHLDKYLAQIKDAQSIVADKTNAWQQEMFKNKRLHEEVITYKRKYERAKKFELAATADEVLQEEIRELREELTCPSCKTKRKDAVLNKCFHVFCYDCLKTRYETRQRKCPKCNQSFAANDFHRLYLA